jgi:predicted TIM-barrel enzyme
LGRKFDREEILQRLSKTLKDGKPIVGAGCSAGIIAKCAEIGGADLVIAYSTGLSRLKGLPTTMYGSMVSNAITLSMFEELDNVVNDTPIIGGIDASDPTCWDLRKLLKRFSDVGFSGMINFPTMGLYGDREATARYRRGRESQGLGWKREIETMRIAKEMNIFTMAYVYNPDDSYDMAGIPVDVIVAHVGGTGGGLAGFKAASLEEASQLAQRIIEAAKKVAPGVICLAHGGPFAGPQDTEYLYQHTDAVGFVGASSIERVPVENAVITAVKGFKNCSMKAKTSS